MSLKYDDENHIYRDDRGIVYPSITQVLVESGLIETKWYKEYATWRGSAVHRACQFDDDGDLDLNTIDGTVRWYLEAWRKFKLDYDMVIIANEVPMLHAEQFYAGTPDRIASIKTSHGHYGAVIEIKTGAGHAAHSIQTAAQMALAIRANIMPNASRWMRLSVFLKPSGTYDLREHNAKSYIHELRVFLSALRVVQWKRQHNLISKRKDEDERSEERLPQEHH